MASQHKRSARRTLGAFLVLIGMFTTFLSVTGGPASAGIILPGSVGNFQDEGNMAVDASPPAQGTLDWATPAIGGSNGTGGTVVRIGDTPSPGGGDTGVSGKENDPSTWTCTTSGGNNPPKANLLRAYVNSRVSALNSQYLDLAFVREATTGDAHVNFEFNQQPLTCDAAGLHGRTTGDMLIVYDYPGGVSPASVDVYLWDSAITADGEWVGPKSGIVAAGTTNSTTFPDVLTAGSPTVGLRQFGEATVDLTSVFGGGNGLGCPGLGRLNIRSRSSGQSFESNLQDRMDQTPVDVSTCGSVKVKKVDDLGNPMSGITFTLSKNANTYTCTTGTDGICTITEVPPGTGYSLDETAGLSTDYTKDPALPRTGITVNVGQVSDLTGTPVVNSRKVGYVEVTKEIRDGAGNLVAVNPAGAAFALYEDTNNNNAIDAGESQASTWENPANPATCTVQPGDTSCIIGPVVLGEYVVTETAAPTGSTFGSDQPVTVTESTSRTAVQVTYTNTQSDITLNKTVDLATAQVGQAITYTMQATTSAAGGISSVVLDDPPVAGGLTGYCDSAPTGPTGDSNNDQVLDPGETWAWTCTHVIDSSDLTAGSITNYAEVSGQDSNANPVSAQSSATTTIVAPDVVVAKTTTTPNVSVNGAVSYKITVTNQGTAAATSVTVTDTLPSGATWTAPAGCSLTGNDLSCTVGPLAANGGSTDITVTGTATQCGTLSNVASATVNRQTESNTTNNTSSPPAVISVACPPPPPPPPPPGVGAINVTKTGPATAHVGDAVTYTVDVENTGTVVVNTVTVTDPVCDGSVTRTSGDATLDPGETWTYECTHTITASDPDPLPNTATAAAKDANGNDLTDTGSHSVDVIHPAVGIDKTANPTTVAGGSQVTFTYVVTNSGDVELHDVVVDDDILGNIGTIPTLPAGQSVTLTKTVTVGEGSAPRNVGTVRALDPLDKVVSASDDAVISIVLGEQITQETTTTTTTAPPQAVVAARELPRTGSDTSRQALFGILLALVGFLLVGAEQLAKALRPDPLMVRVWHPGDEAELRRRTAGIVSRFRRFGRR